MPSLYLNSLESRTVAELVHDARKRRAIPDQLAKRILSEVEAVDSSLTVGIDRVWEERLRQVGVEGWTREHDLTHPEGTLAAAGACYALTAIPYTPRPFSVLPRPKFWPFDDVWWKPSDDVGRNLEKAGALIVAELDRLL